MLSLTRFAGTTLLAVLLLLPPAGAALADVLEEVVRDLQPVSGYVIMPVGEEFLIDLDAGRQVAPGDLFSVVVAGERIVHPVTKEVLGRLDEVKGRLQVTRVKSGYSYARPLGGAGKIERGAAIRRFEHIPAVFWDYTGAGDDFFAKLKAALPALEWRDYAVAQVEKPPLAQAPAGEGDGLYFVLTRQGLEVRGPRFGLLHAYGAPAGLARVAGAPAAATPPVPAPTPPVGGGAVTWQGPAPGEAGAGGFAAEFPGYQNRGSLPEGTRMTDFFQDGDRLLIASTDGRKLFVHTLDQSLTLLTETAPPRPGELLSVHWWRPAGQSSLYLAATLSVEVNQANTPYIPHKAVSDLFRFDGSRLVPVRGDLPYVVGSFDRNGDGIPETLLGQRFDRDVFFGEAAELYWQDGDVGFRSPSFELPRRFAVQGGQMADLNGDGRLEFVSVRNRVLSIFGADQMLYESPQQFGGSLSNMTYEANPGAQDTLFRTEPFEVSPVARDLDGDGVPELIAIGSEGSSFRAPGIGPAIKQSWLAVLKYRDGMFVKGRIGDDLGVPLQGLHVTADDVLFVATEPGSILGRPGNSHLLSFPLNANR